MLLSLLLVFSFILQSYVLGDEFIIHDKSEFIEFSNSVHNGYGDYSRTTVYLDTDIDLSSDTIEPIGKTTTNYFRGTFDGQGHIISNLAIDSSSEYVGLFGYSDGTIIRNVVFDDSCSVMSSHESGNAHAGSIIGKCYGSESSCIIENNICMGRTTFSGSTNSAYLGGIVGYISSSSKYSVTVKNNANYGSVTHSGHSDYSYIGGIAGYADGFETKILMAYLQNNLNLGTVMYSETSSDNLYIGGIVGYNEYSVIDNCVNYGTITSGTTSDNLGNIVGRTQDSSISHCYWNEDVKYNEYGSQYCSKISHVASFDNNFVLNEAISIGDYKGTSLVETLNAAADYYDLRDYSHWIINKNENSVKFNVKSLSSSSTMKYKIILLPNLLGTGNNMFNGWYTDSACTTKISSYEVDSGTVLYGKFEEDTKTYTITFDTKGGSSIDPITGQVNTIVELPNNTVRDDGCTFMYWENKYGDEVSSKFTITAHDVTLHAVWLCTHIKTAKDLTDLSKVVDSKALDYLESTVYLDADIDFNGVDFEPIGKDDNHAFKGVFDGQGHIISNLVINSFSENTGLFGHSMSPALKNVVLDDSCSITSSSRSNTHIYLGGLVGRYDPYNSAISIEGVVNMARVTLSKSLSTSEVDVGGIVGYVSSSDHIIVKNCANYGSVTHSGVGKDFYIGGIIGKLASNSQLTSFVQNNFNFGAITFSGTSSNYLYIGGIVGNNPYLTISNCVGYGTITVNGETEKDCIGSIAGGISNLVVSHCYWNKAVGYDGFGGGLLTTIPKSTSFDNNFVLNKTISAGSYRGTSLIEALNAAADYYDLRDYSHWVLNKNENNIKFTVKSSSFTMKYKIILLPNFANTGLQVFNGWYTDSACTTKISSYEISANTELYGKFEEDTKTYTITFDTEGGSSISPITGQVNTIVELPNNTAKNGCTFVFWETGYGDNVSSEFTIPAHDVTLSAVWLCTHIKTVNELSDFSNIVNFRISNFNGTTVYLDADLVLTDNLFYQFEPIGNDYGSCFLGTFDGQGHTISNLKMDPSSDYAGLFGYSEGATIKNVVLDESCLITGSNYYAYIGGIIGECKSKYDSCTIENCVNKGNVSYNGDLHNYEAYVGGIVGHIESNNYNSAISNCTNYGFITNYGNSDYVYVGGIAGKSGGESYLSVVRKLVYIKNCTNYGNVSDKGQTNNAYVDGIAGDYTRTEFENCLDRTTKPSSPSSASSRRVLSAMWVLFLVFLMC